MELDPLASPFDTQEKDIFTLEQPRTVATPYQGVTRQNYGVGQQYESPEEALGALPSYLGGLQEQRVATDKEFNRLNYDPSEFVRAGFSPTPRSVSKGAALDSAIDYITKNKIPLSKEVDGQTRYLTTGLGADVYRADKDFDYKAGSYEAQGPVGTYSTVHVKPKSPLDNKFLAAVGMFLPPVALATTAAKVAAGESLTPMEIVSAGMAGLNAAGITRPATGAAAGGVGPVDKGQGLFGTTYNQTQTLMRAAAADNLEGGVVQVFAPQVIEGIKGKLPELNIPETGLPEDFEAGLVKTVEKMAGGSSFEDALKAGGIQYIREGGLKPLEGVIKEAVKPLGAIIEPIKETFAALDKNVLQPVTKPIGDVLSAADTAVRQALPSLGSVGIDLPKIGLGMLTGASTISPTRTTDDIFKDDLFKFKTKIEVSPLEQLLRSPQARQQQQQEVVGLYDDPFASSFDERNTFQL